MGKVPSNVRKAFAVASCIGSAVKLAESRTIKLNAIDLQANKAMRVFRAKAGSKEYWTISNSISEIWMRLSKKHTTLLSENALSLYIEMMCMMIPPKDFKEFMNVSAFKSSAEVDPETYALMAKSILALDGELNSLFGTKPYSIVVKKEKKVKEIKERDKAKPKKLKMIRNRARWMRRRVASEQQSNA